MNPPFDHIENLVTGTIYLFVMRSGEGELFGGNATFRGIQLHDRHLYLALQFLEEDAELERWVAWLDVADVLFPREDDDDDKGASDAINDGEAD